MNNNNNQYNYGQITNAQKYSRARVSLIIFFILAFANVLFIMIGSFNFGISSAIATSITFVFKAQAANPLFFALGIIVGIICTLPIIVTFVMSKKKTGFICFAFYWVCLDFLVLVLDFMLVLTQNPVGATSYLADLAFHAWMLYTVRHGVKVRSELDEE